MLTDPKFQEYPEDRIQNFVDSITKPNPQFPESVMTEAAARQWIYDQSHPERPEGHPVGIFYAWQLEHNIEGIKSSRYGEIAGITIRPADAEDNPRWVDMCGHQPWELPSYGVCDNVEQVLARFNLNIPDRKFCIGIAPILKSEQSERGGWRWHKWGPYIGTHKPECEYLYDEVGIEQVLIYHIYELE